MARGYDGQVHQNAHEINARDYAHERMNSLYLGIILEVKIADNPTNSQYKFSNDKTNHRGTRVEASVLITHGHTDTSWIVPNAAVITGGLTGIDDYSEEIPKGTTQTLDGSSLTDSLLDYNKLDGERCIVQFVGGMIEQPVITHWYPHPANNVDAATSGLADGSLVQSPRLFKRYNGVKFIVTNKGNTYVDTTEGNTRIVGNPVTGKPERDKRDSGGDLQINVKDTAKFEINFNPTVNLPESEPSLPQPNYKSSPKIDGKRSTDLTRLTMDKEFITAIASEVVSIVSNNSDIIVQPAGNLYLGSEEASENFVMGQAYKSFIETLIDQIKLVTVPTAFGPSGVPNNSAIFDQIKLTIDNHLSNFIFGQSSPGDPT